MLCYGVFTASAHAALTDDVATLRAETPPLATPRTPTTYSTHTIIFIRHVIPRFDSYDRDVAAGRLLKTGSPTSGVSTGVDGFLNGLDDKRLEVSLHRVAKAPAAAHFKGICS
eukprot:jgi/Tetstr1/459845/TSEL_005194.t1